MDNEFSVIIQLVETHWAAYARGGEGARERNSVAPAYVLPPHAVANKPMLHHLLYRHDFDVPDETCEPAPFTGSKLIKIPGLTISLQKDGRWQAALSWNRVDIGAPVRRNHPVLTLSSSEWGSFAINGRNGSTLTHGTTWTYRQLIYNIGIGITDLNTFVSTEPKRRTSELADLF